MYSTSSSSRVHNLQVRIILVSWWSFKLLIWSAGDLVLWRLNIITLQGNRPTTCRPQQLPSFILDYINCNLQVPTVCPTCTTRVEPASESCKEATAVTAPQVAPQIQTQYVVISIDLNERSHARTPSQHLARFRQGGWTGLIMGTHLQFQWNILHTFK